MYQAPGSPLSIGGVLDSGFKLFAACFVQVFLFAVAASLITAPASYLATPYIQANGVTPAVIGGMFGGGLVLAILTTIFTSALIARIDGVWRGESMTARDALARGLHRTFPALGSYLLMTVAISAVPLLVVAIGLGAGVSLPALIAFAVVLALIPGSVIAIWLIFGPLAAVADRLGPLTSLRYSRAITRGHWWRTTALVTIIMIILFVIYIAMGIVAAIAMVANPEALTTGQSPWWIQFIVSPLLSAFAVPLFYSLLLAIYYDLKLRHEGGDLAARIAGTA